MQGNHALAGLHIQSGAKLLRETVYDQRNRVLQHQVLGSKSQVDSYAPLEVLARIFSGLDSQVRMVRGLSSALPDSIVADACRIDDWRLPVRALSELFLWDSQR